MANINQAIMHAQEPIDGREGSAYAVIDGRRFLIFQLIDFEDTITKTKTEIPRLGTTKTGNRSSGAKGTWTANLYYNTDIFRQLMYEYWTTGRDLYFDIQITNDDPNSNAGRHTVIYKDCNLDSLSMSKLNVKNTILEEQISGTFEDLLMPETFSILDGME